MSGSNDQGTIICCVPALYLLRYYLIERPDLSILALYLQILEIMCAWIGRSTEQKNAFIVISQKWSHAIVSHIGIYSYSIASVFIKYRGGVVARSIADIATFGIDNNWYIFRNSLDDFLKYIHSAWPQYFKKG